MNRFGNERVFGLMWIWVAMFVLVVTSGALVASAAVAWEERRRVPKVVPMCAGCGYDLVGLATNAACPECARVGERAYRPIAECPKRRAVLEAAWKWPAGCALVVVGLLAAVGGGVGQWGPMAASVLGVFAALAAGLVMLAGWLTPRGGWVMVIGACVATTGVLGAVIVSIALGVLSVPLSDLAVLCWTSLPLMGAGVGPGVVVSVREKW